MINRKKGGTLCEKSLKFKMCIRDSTNITSNRFICFGTKGITDADTAIRNAMLFNVLSFMSDALLSKGNTAAFIDELYLFLTNMTAIEYIRNAMKRVRKKGSAVIIASQNIEDFNRADVREMTKPSLRR